MRDTLKRLFDREPWKTIFPFVISAFVMFMFYRVVLKNPALDPERMGQRTEAAGEGTVSSVSGKPLDNSEGG